MGMANPKADKTGDASAAKRLFGWLKGQIAGSAAASGIEGTVAKPTGAARRKYKFVKPISKGAFGTVWLCKEKCTGRHLACKVVDKRSLPSVSAVLYLEQEVDVMRRLARACHPGIVQLHQVEDCKSKAELIMEYCEGGDLFDYIQTNGALPEEKAKSIFTQLVSAVAFCHSQGIMHRDIKNENIVLTSDFETGALKAKLVDFGYATRVCKGEVVMGAVGTKFYVAPEVVEGDGYKTNADVFSLGVILYTLLSGELPRDPQSGTTKSSFWWWIREGKFEFDRVNWGSISPLAQDLLRKMLECDPLRRWDSHQVLEHSWLTPSDANKEKPALTTQISNESLCSTADSDFAATLFRKLESCTSTSSIGSR